MHAIYPNRTEAWKELEHRLYKIGRSKFYKDCLQGLCKLEPDGSIRESSLEEYIQDPMARLRRLDKIHDERNNIRGRQGAFLVIPVDSPRIREVLSALTNSKSGDDDGKRSL